MKCNIKSLIGFTMGATDGEVGKVTDVYFDDHTWTVRYIIVETGGWLSGRKVLISPESILTPDHENKTFPVNLTIDQIKHSPDIDTDRPVSRQQEMELIKHYPWSSYWAGGLGAGSLWGGGIGTTGMMGGSVELFDSPVAREGDDESVPAPAGDPQLRSYDNVKGSLVNATDGGVGDVEDFIVDESTWKIDMLVIDTGSLLPGKKVLIAPQLIKEIDWSLASVTINANVDTVKHSPEYDSTKPFTEEHKESLHNYFGDTTV